MIIKATLKKQIKENTYEEYPVELEITDEQLGEALATQLGKESKLIVDIIRNIEKAIDEVDEAEDVVSEN